MVGWRNGVLGGVLLLGTLVGFFGWAIGGHPLWDVDEARHAQVAREMVSGQGFSRFLLPTFDHEPYREKPPAFYLLVSAAYALGGVSAGSARAVDALAALLTVLAVYVFASRREGADAGLGAAFVTATCVGFAGLARYANLDMVLTAVVTPGVLAGLAWLDAPSPRPPLRAPYLAAALAVLVKGPIGAILVVLPLLAAMFASATRPAWRELGLGRGLIVFATIAGGVAAAISVFDPTYLWQLATTNLRRFSTHAPHAAPVYYYLLWFPAIVMPWTVLAGPALWRAVRAPEDRPLLAWLVAVLALFSLPHGKLATYVLPAIPAFGLVVGPALVRAMRDDDEDDDRWLRIGGWTHCVLLAATAVGATAVAAAGGAPVAALVVIAAAGWWAVLTVVALRRELPGAVPAIVAASALTGMPLILNLVAPMVSARYSDAGAAALARRMQVETVIAFRSQSPSLLFYSPAPVVHVEKPALLREFFTGTAPVMVVTGRRHLPVIERTLGSLAHRWLDTGRRVTFGNLPLLPE